MDQLIVFIYIIHVFAAVCIIGLVLVQQGKGATMGAAFGSGASQTVFGSRGSGSFLFRLTIGLAVVFFATSIALNNIATKRAKQSEAVNFPFNLPAPTQEVPVAPMVTPDSIPGVMPGNVTKMQQPVEKSK